MTNKLTDELKIKIKDQFVHGYVNELGVRNYPTVDGLVEIHNVARATLYRAVQSESWQATKNEVQTALEQIIEDERINKMFEESKRLDTNSITIAQTMLAKVARRLQEDFVELAKEKDERKNGFKPISAKELLTLSHSASNAQKIGKLALGQAQEISKVAANVSTPDALRRIFDQLDEIDAHTSSRAGHTYQ
tara:strand:+ start:548 stop:1123 length:576 start_codon:yes stop_codon:yes gene_type:complete